MAPTEAVFYWAALALYALASAGLVYAFVFRNERFIPRMLVLTALAFVLHTCAIAARYAAQGHLPWAGDYETSLACAWFIVALTFAASWRTPALRALSVGTVPLVVLLMGFGVTRNPTLGPLAASLRSGWLVVHVFFAWLAFGAYGLATAGGIAHELKRRGVRRAERNPAWDRLPALERLDELIFRWILFGFIADTVMIASGAIWARDLWGSYWSWDPVEVWSLVVWLSYGLAIHLRLTRGWKGAPFARVAIAAITGMFVTFFGVSFMVEASSHVFNVR